MSVTLGPKLGLLINANTGETYVDQFRPFLRAIDELLLGSFINSTTTTPPSSPNNGDAYLLLGSPTGAWSGHANQLAVWSTEICTAGTDTRVPGWDFQVPNPGWLLWDVAAGNFKLFSAGAWAVFTSGGSSSITLTTTGSSGAATLVGTTLNIPQYSSGGGSSMVYPGAGVAVSNGSAWATSLSAPSSAIVGISDTQTLTNKSIDAGQLTGSLASGVSVPVAQVTGLASSATTDTTNAGNITSGILSSARLPSTIANCSAGIALAPSSPGNFTASHSLGVVPKAVIIEMTSGGQLWLQSPTSYDTTSVYLVASDAGVTGNLKLLY